ncbi:MAG: penicillin acylase family protein [Acidobacteriota bacterium]
MARGRVVRWGVWGGGAAAGIVAVAMVAGLVAVRDSLWQPSAGELHLTGLHGPAEIAIDGAGVPHVRAATPRDAFFLEGYLHARERFFQMELTRRLASGTLAALLGRAALPADLRARRLNLAATAARQTAELDGETRDVLEAYAAGVNAALSQRGPTGLAPELLLVRGEIPPWRAADTVGVGLVLADDLTDAASEERRRFAELRSLGRPRAVGLWGWSEDQARDWIPADLAALGSGPASVELGSRQPALGSNNWAIAPARTSTGAALLANDPHLGVANPSTWYEVHLEAPGLAVAGASVPGAPGVLIGHNGDIAWGMTMFMLDDQDLFRLRLDGSGERELVGDRYVPLEIRREGIAVRGGSPAEVVVKISTHGPVVREQVGEAEALAWTALLGRSALAGFLRLDTARSVSEAVAAFDTADPPALNMVCADREGHIRWQVIGRVPIRGRGAGRLPAPGWDPAWNWQGLASAAADPAIQDPAAGFLATANHDPYSEGDFASPPIPGEFASPWRVRSIRASLDARREWDVAACQRLQMDDRDPQALALIRALAPTLRAIGSPAAHRLLAWDGRMSADSRDALLWAEFLRDLTRRIGGDEASAGGLSRTPLDGDDLLRLLAGTLDPAWWDDVGTPAVETPGAVVAASLTTAETRAAGGTWGSRHVLLFRHPFDGVPLVGRLFDQGPFGVGGDPRSIDATGYRAQGEGFGVNALPSLRFVADLSDWDRSVFTLPLGQSGHPLSRHVADQARDWLAGRAHRMPWSRDAVAAAAVAVLRLEPAAASH